MAAAEGGGSGPAAALLAEAARIDTARVELQGVQAAWRDEAARLQVLEQALQAEVARLRQRQDELDERIDALRESVAVLEEGTASVRSLQEREAELAGRIAAVLRETRAHTPLALQDLGGDAESPAVTLTDAFAALNAAEGQARRITRRTVAGTLPDGSRRAVQALVLGGAAAWWQAADGSAGIGHVVDGGLHCQPIAARDLRDRIRSALAVQAGERAARLVGLPLPADPEGD